MAEKIILMPVSFQSFLYFFHSKDGTFHKPLLIHRIPLFLTSAFL